MKKMIIAGGTGFLGQVLKNYFKEQYAIKILTRKPVKENHIYWDAKQIGDWLHEVDGSEVLINLTGKSVDCRYTPKNKKLIYDSRIDSTKILGEAINHCENPPKVWINSSTATIYEHSLITEMTEGYGKIGNDFSMNIAKSWEEAFNQAEVSSTRKVIIRTSIVLGKNGGAFIPLKNLTRFGLGGKQGLGNQKVSWIHKTDFARAIEFLINNKDLNGVFNITVPKPTDNKSLMSALRKAYAIPVGLNHPIWLLKLGAKIIGTETELVLKSRNVIPERLLTQGFEFRFSIIENAIKNLT